MTEKQELSKKVSISTFGCQMNFYDTEVASGLLKSKGYRIVREFDEDPELRPIVTKKDPSYGADIVLMNTCSVREHAEDRVFGRLGLLGQVKKEKPELIVGLMGCMVEEHKEKLFKRFPQLDLMVGTRNINELPGLIEKIEKDREQVAKIKQDGISIEYSEQTRRNTPWHAWLPIMTGCNKRCTFCIVPFTRGEEVSMKARDVYREVSRLVEDGVKWVTLLGQNVNSYEGADGAAPFQPLQDTPVFEGNAGGHVSFPELLDTLCTIEGLERLSFTTSHPHDATEELFQVMKKNPKISRRFHLPLQSGSDSVLKRMKRLHTYEDFKKQIDRLRELVPDVSLTTDIITGFCGETEEDHEATRKALEELRFDDAFIYKYSVRPKTPAEKLSDDVSFEDKHRRNLELLEVQKKITEEISNAWLGKTVLVYVESINFKTPGELKGRNDQDKKVVFEGPKDLIGKFVNVKFEERRHETFRGKIAD